MLTLPAARYWMPLLAGKTRAFEPMNEAYGRNLTTEYPCVAVFPMAASVKAAVQFDYSAVNIPVLFQIQKNTAL